MSSTSPTPRGGADGSGSCRGADDVDFPGRVFAISSKVDKMKYDFAGKHRTRYHPTEDLDPGRPSLGLGQQGLEDLHDNWYGCGRSSRAFERL